MLPPELETPPPRDLRAASQLFAKNLKRARSLPIGARLITPAVLGLFALRSSMRGRPPVDGLSIGLSVGIGALVALMALAMWVQLKRGQTMYRDGIATLGRVREVKAP